MLKITENKVQLTRGDTAVLKNCIQGVCDPLVDF